MAKFLFKAKAANGKIQVGQIEALDENDVKSRLKQKNLVTLQVVRGGGSGISATRPSGGGLFEPTLGTRDLLIFTRQFATLISAGIPIVDGLKILSEGKRNVVIKDAALKVKESIESGKKLSDAMLSHPKVFDKLFVNMIRAGEEAGILDQILLRLATYLEKSDKIKKQVKSAMFYPAMVLVVAIAVVSGLLFFIVPKFQDMYRGMGKELPGLTQFIVNMSNTIQAKWYIIFGIVFAVPYLISTYYKSPQGRETIDRYLIYFPVIGPVIQKASIARMTRTLSTLLSSGVGVVEALEISARTSGNKVVEDVLMRSKDFVMSGKPLALPLSREAIIPDMVSQMITIGEQSGTLDGMLAKIADFYEDDVESAVKTMTQMIEPLMMVFIGGIIAFIVVAMYLPIFNMGNIVGAQ